MRQTNGVHKVLVPLGYVAFVLIPLVLTVGYFIRRADDRSNPPAERDTASNKRPEPEHPRSAPAKPKSSTSADRRKGPAKPPGFVAVTGSTPEPATPSLPTLEETTPPRPPAPEREPVEVAPLPRRATWKFPVDGYSSKWVTIGAVDVRIGSLAVCNVRTIDGTGADVESKTPYLVVVVEAKKNTKEERRSLLAWWRYKSNAAFGGEPAVLFFPDDRAVGPARLPGKLNVDLPEKQLLPDDGSPVRDVILFAVPSNDAGELRLRLVAERCGESGDYWLKIPPGAWKQK